MAVQHGDIVSAEFVEYYGANTSATTFARGQVIVKDGRATLAGRFLGSARSYSVVEKAKPSEPALYSTVIIDTSAHANHRGGYAVFKRYETGWSNTNHNGLWYDVSWSDILGQGPLLHTIHPDHTVSSHKG